MPAPKAPISFTQKALEELGRLKTKHTDVAQYLRVGTKGAGCSGYSYLLAFDHKRDDDRLFEIEGIQVVIEPKQVMYVLGLEIDFQVQENSRGFVFRNALKDSAE